MADGMSVSGVRTYNPSVRVGNWNEDVSLEEVHIISFTSGQKQYFLCRIY